MTYAFVLFALTVGLLALRVNLFVVLLVLGSFIHLVWGDAELIYVVEDMWIALDKEVLLSIPLFLICGSEMGRGAITARLIAVMTCAVFAAISGLAIALSVNLLLTAHQAPGHPAEWISGFITNKITFLLAVNVLLLIMGCVRDIVSAILILARCFWPLGAPTASIPCTWTSS
jgi:TRAP-type C4-dicarboxylate transport system permease large subunit